MQAENFLYSILTLRVHKTYENANIFCVGKLPEATKIRVIALRFILRANVKELEKNSRKLCPRVYDMIVYLRPVALSSAVRGFS